jgi:DNA-binding CsgD family transcriptional regulator/tetratricopeptide (TPR) repeat protein
MAKGLGVVDKPAVSGGRRDRVSVVSPPEFVGRVGELAVLAEALASPPAVVLIEGEAGIGKSRLVREFWASSRAPRLVAVAACPPLREPYTLGPVVDALRRVAVDGPAGLGLSDLAGVLRPLFPEWAGDLPAAPEPAEDATAARHRLFRALTELLGCLGVAVLAVEDVHWADDATLEFLLFLLSCQPPPVSLVVSYRPEDVPAGSLLLRLSSRLPSGTTQARVVVGPLDMAETASMVSSMLCGERLSDEFAAFVYERTDGVPLAVEESVRLMLDRADVARAGDGWIRRHLTDIDVPPTVRDAVLERTRRLGEHAQVVLRAAAVFGDPVGEATLAAVSGLPADQTVAGLAGGLACGLLQEGERGLVSFRHVLAAKAVYEDFPGPQRRAMHLRAGRVLENVSPPPVAQLAHHFRRAGDTESWARYAERAAGVATAAGDWVTAATLLHGLLSSAELPPAAVAPLVARIPPGVLGGQTSVEDVAQALRSALDSGELDARQEALTRYHLGDLLEDMYDYDASRREMELAIPHLEPGSHELLVAMTYLGWPVGSSCPGRVHRDWLRRAAEAASSALPEDQADISVKRATALLMLGEPEGWVVAGTVSDEVSTPMQRWNVALRDLNLGDLALRWGRYTQARNRLGHALELAEAYGYLKYCNSCYEAQIRLDWFTGTWDGLAERATDLVENQNALPMDRLQAFLVNALLLAADGRCADAEKALTRVLAQMRELGAVESLAEPAAALARMYLSGGRIQDALAVTQEPIAVVVLKETWLWATELAPARVEALVAAGQSDEAEELLAAFADGVRGRDAPAPEAAAIVCEGILAAGRGEPARAASAFARAASAWDALPRPYDALLTQERQARCLLATGQREAGLSLLGEVLTGLSELGARAATARVRDALKEQGGDAAGPRRGGRPGYGDQLSPRELEVVRLLVDGRTNRRIAEALVVSHQTVNSHVRSAMRKLGAPSRTALAVSAVELGLTRADRPS